MLVMRFYVVVWVININFIVEQNYNINIATSFMKLMISWDTFEDVVLIITVEHIFERMDLTVWLLNLSTFLKLQVKPDYLLKHPIKKYFSFLKSNSIPRYPQ